MNDIYIQVISTDDYQWVYFNNKLVSEGHSFNEDEVLEKLIGQTVLSYKSAYVDEYEIENYQFIGQGIVDSDLLDSLFE